MSTTFRTVLVLFFFTCLWSCKEKFNKDKTHKHTNALASETSPYLLQHAHNPVDWRPWSQEALDEAKRDEKLVLVSVGYSSCHWCHVMEKETFEDEEVAKMMNENFINIKVDREERPDVDRVYMTALQLFGKNPGWPLNVITLPNGKPLYGGTYHTKAQWNEALSEISRLFNENPEKAYEYGDQVAEGIQEANIIEPAVDHKGITKEILQDNIEKWRVNWDLEWGGDLVNQKFMFPSRLDFLMDYAVVTEDKAMKVHVKKTLDKMLLGGVYDHAAGGFFRYSTDKYWKVPHFEKMLYDNAQLIGLYAKAYKAFKDPAYENLVMETANFLKREMKHSDGAYYAALDADSEGEEGKFYVWTSQELNDIMGADFELFSEYYNITPDALWEGEHYILHNAVSDSEFIARHNLNLEAFQSQKENWKSLLLEARTNRVRPNLDDKILISWNALLIDGYLEAYKAFKNVDYLNEARTIFGTLMKNGFDNGNLLHSYKENSRPIAGFLEDYVYLTAAALNLYTVTLEPNYLEFATELQETTAEQFIDISSGMYRYNSSNELISKIIKIDDAATPSPNAVMAQNLFLMGHIQYNTEALEKSKQMLSTMLPQLNESVQHYAKWSTVFLHTAYPFYEIAAVGTDAQEKVRTLQELHLPNTLIIGSAIESELPLFTNRFVPDETFIYVCQNSTCKLPVTTTNAALEQLKHF